MINFAGWFVIVLLTVIAVDGWGMPLGLILSHGIVASWFYFGGRVDEAHDPSFLSRNSKRREELS